MENGQAEVGQTTIPTKKGVIPKGQKDNPILSVPNFAGKEETVAKVLAHMVDRKDFYIAQVARVAQETRMTDIDAMWRLAKGQEKQDENKTSDEMDSRPGAFRYIVDLQNANMTSILFPRDGSLAIRYAPLQEEDTDLQTAMQMAKARNRLYEYSTEADTRIPKMKQTLNYVTKYSNRVISMEWFYKVHSSPERLPDENGNLEWEIVDEIEAHPVYEDIALDNFWFDCTIDTTAEGTWPQENLIRRNYPSLTQLFEMQEAGHYMNVEKVSRQQFRSEESPSHLESERQSNAGEGTDLNDYNGKLERWIGWVTVPINEKGVWDAEGTMPSLHWCEFSGDIDDAPICLRINPNPYHHGSHPYHLIHHMEDDKGAMHSGLYEKTEPGCTELKTITDQWFYNRNQINAAGWVQEVGAVVSEDIELNPRKVTMMEMGKIDRLKKLAIPSLANDSLLNIEYTEGRLHSQSNTDKPIQGIASGGRTTASESKNIMEQAMLPILMDADYTGAQIFKFVATRDAQLWRQFAPADFVATLPGLDENNQPFKPASIYGSFLVKLVAVDDYYTDAISRMEMDKAVQGVLPVAAQHMSGPQILGFTAAYFKKRMILPVEEIDKAFGTEALDDARHLARSENIQFAKGFEDNPTINQMHDIHIPIHEHLRAELELFPKESVLKTGVPVAEVIRIIDAHLLRTKQLVDQKLARAQASEQQMAAQQAPEPTGLPKDSPVQTQGDAAQNMLGAIGGELAP